MVMMMMMMVMVMVMVMAMVMVMVMVMVLGLSLMSNCSFALCSFRRRGGVLCDEDATFKTTHLFGPGE